MGALQYLVFVVLVVYAAGWRDYTLVPENLIFEDVNEKMLSNVSMVFYKPSRTRIAFNSTAYLKVPIRKSFLIKFHVAEYYGRRYHDTPLMDMTVDLCGLRNNPVLGPIEKIVVANCEKYSNYCPKGCPVPPGYYSFFNATIDEESLPPYLPGEKWRIDMTHIYRNQTMLKVMVFFRIDRNLKLRETLLRKHG